MTKDEAVALLNACKPLAERVMTTFPAGMPPNYNLTSEDLGLLAGFDRVQNDPVVAGPGLLNRLFNSAGLTQTEVYKLAQLKRLVFKRRYEGRNAANGFKANGQ